MKKTLLVIRIFFFVLCLFGAYLLWFVASQDEGGRQALGYYLLSATLLATLTILVDILLKGFSLRGLTSVSFGLGMGALISYLISVSPLFEQGEPEILYLARLSLFLASMYLCTVITLRGKDEFNLVIPFVRFVPQKVDLPIVVIDDAALIDGRVLKVCESGFLNAELIVPQFVVDKLRHMADAPEPANRRLGHKGLEVLTKLRQMDGQRVLLHDTEILKNQRSDEKILYIAKSLNGRVLTTDYQLAKLADLEDVGWLNINALAGALRTEVNVGDQLTLVLVKSGKDPKQAIGYHLGEEVQVTIESILPSGSGKMLFAKLLQPSDKKVPTKTKK